LIPEGFSRKWGPTPNYLVKDSYHLLVGRTQGSETSQYLKEEKSTEIPLVAASERGTARVYVAYEIIE